MEEKNSQTAAAAGTPTHAAAATGEPVVRAENIVVADPFAAVHAQKGKTHTMRGEPANQPAPVPPVAGATTISEAKVETAWAGAEHMPGRTVADFTRWNAEDAATENERLASGAHATQEGVAAESGGRGSAAKKRPARRKDGAADVDAATQHTGNIGTATEKSGEVQEVATQTTAFSDDQLLTQLGAVVIPQSAAVTATAADATTPNANTSGQLAGATAVDVALVSAAVASPPGEPGRAHTVTVTAQSSCAEWRVTREQGTATQSSTSDFSSINTNKSTSSNKTNNGTSKEWGLPAPPSPGCPVATDVFGAGSFRSAAAGSRAPVSSVVIAAGAARDGFGEPAAGGAAAISGAATPGDTSNWTSVAAAAQAIRDSNGELEPPVIRRKPQHLQEDLWLTVKKNSLLQQSSRWGRTAKELSPHQQQQSDYGVVQDEQQRHAYVRTAAGSLLPYIKASTPSAPTDPSSGSSGGSLPRLSDKLGGATGVLAAARGRDAALYSAEAVPAAAAAFVSATTEGTEPTDAALHGLPATTDTETRAPDDIPKSAVENATGKATTSAADKASAPADISTGVSAAETRELSIVESTVEQQVESGSCASLPLLGNQLHRDQTTRILNDMRGGAGLALFGPSGLHDGSTTSPNSAASPAAVKGTGNGSADAWVDSNPFVADANSKTSPQTVLPAKKPSRANTSDLGAADVAARSAATLTATLFPRLPSDALAVTTGNAAPHSVLRMRSSVPATPVVATCKPDGLSASSYTCNNTNSSVRDNSTAQKTNSVFTVTPCGRSKCSVDGNGSNSSPRYRSDSTTHRTCSFCSIETNKQIFNRDNNTSPNLTCCGSEVGGTSYSNSRHSSSDSVGSSNGSNIFLYQKCCDNGEREKRLSTGRAITEKDVHWQHQQQQSATEQQLFIQHLHQQLRRVPAHVSTNEPALVQTGEHKVAEDMFSAVPRKTHAPNHKKRCSDQTSAQQEDNTPAAVAASAESVIAAQSFSLETVLKAALLPPASFEDGLLPRGQEQVCTAVGAEGASSGKVAGPAALGALDVHVDAAIKFSTTVKKVDAVRGRRTEGVTVDAAPGPSVAATDPLSIASKALAGPVPRGSTPPGRLSDNCASVAVVAPAAFPSIADVSSVGCTVRSCGSTVSLSQEILATLVQQKEQLVQVLKQLLLHQQHHEGELLPLQQQQHVLFLLQQQQHHPHFRLIQQQSQAMQFIPEHEQASLDYLQQRHTMELLLQEQQRATQKLRSQQQQQPAQLLLQQLQEHNSVNNPVSPRALLETLLYHPTSLSYTTASRISPISGDGSGTQTSSKGDCRSSCVRGSNSRALLHTESSRSSNVEEKHGICSRLVDANNVFPSNSQTYEAACSEPDATGSPGARSTTKQQSDAVAASMAIQNASPPSAVVASEGENTGWPRVSSSPRFGEKAVDASAGAATARAEAELLFCPDDLGTPALSPGEQQAFLQSSYDMHETAEAGRHVLFHPFYALSRRATAAAAAEKHLFLHPDDAADAAATAADAEHHISLQHSDDVTAQAAAEPTALKQLQQHGREAESPAAKRLRKDSSAEPASTQVGGDRGAAVAGCGKETTSADVRRPLHTSGAATGAGGPEDITVAPASEAGGAPLNRRSTGAAIKRTLAPAGSKAGSTPRRTAAAITGKKEQTDTVDYAVRGRTCERVSGVCFDRWNQGWIATWRNQRRPVHKHYSVKKYGFEQARLLAIHHRHCMVLKQQQEQQRQFQQDLSYRAQAEQLHHQWEWQQKEQVLRYQQHLEEANNLRQQTQPLEQQHVVQSQDGAGARSGCGVLTMDSCVLMGGNPKKETTAQAPTIPVAAGTTSPARQRLHAPPPITAAAEATKADPAVAPSNETYTDLVAAVQTEKPQNHGAAVESTAVPEVHENGESEEVNSDTTLQPRPLLAHADLACSAAVALSSVSGAACAREEELLTPRRVAARSIPRTDAGAAGTPKPRATEATALKRGAAASLTKPTRRSHAVTPPSKALAVAYPRGSAGAASRKKQPLKAAAAVPESPRTPENTSAPAPGMISSRAAVTSLYWDRLSGGQQDFGLADLVTTPRLEGLQQQQEMTESWADVATLVARMPKVERVSFDFTNHSWIAQWKQQGSATYRRFAVSKFGFHGAFQLAVLYKEQHYRPVAPAPCSPTTDASARYAAAAAGVVPVVPRQRRRRGAGGVVHHSKTSKKQRQQQHQQQKGQQQQKQPHQQEQQQQYHRDQFQLQGEREDEQTESPRGSTMQVSPQVQHQVVEYHKGQQETESSQPKEQLMQVQDQQQPTPDKKRKKGQLGERPLYQAQQQQQRSTERQQQSEQADEQGSSYRRTARDRKQAERQRNFSAGRSSQRKQDQQHHAVQNCVADENEKQVQPEKMQRRQKQQLGNVIGRQERGQEQVSLDSRKKRLQLTTETLVPVGEDSTGSVTAQQRAETPAAYAGQGKEEQTEKEGNLEEEQDSREIRKPLAQSLRGVRRNGKEVVDESGSSVGKSFSPSSCNSESTIVTGKLNLQAERQADAATVKAAVEAAKQISQVPSAEAPNAGLNATQLLQTAGAFSADGDVFFSTAAPVNPYLQCLVPQTSLPMQATLKQHQSRKGSAWLLLQHQEPSVGQPEASVAGLHEQCSKTGNNNRGGAGHLALPILPPLACPVALSTSPFAYPPAVTTATYPAAATSAAYPAAATALACPPSAAAYRPPATPPSPGAPAVPVAASGTVAAAPAAAAARETPSGERSSSGGAARDATSLPGSVVAKPPLQEPDFTTATMAALANASDQLQVDTAIVNCRSPDAAATSAPPPTAAAITPRAKRVPGTVPSGADTTRKTQSVTTTGGQELPLGGRQRGQDLSKTLEAGPQLGARPAILKAPDLSAYICSVAATSPTAPRRAAATSGTQGAEAGTGAEIAAAGAGGTRPASATQKFPAPPATSQLPSWISVSSPPDMWSSPFLTACCTPRLAAAVAAPHRSVCTADMGIPVFPSSHQNGAVGPPLPASTPVAASDVALSAAVASNPTPSDTAAPAESVGTKTLLQIPQQLQTQQARQQQVHDQQVHSPPGHVWLQQVGPRPGVLHSAHPAAAISSSRVGDAGAAVRAGPTGETGLQNSSRNSTTGTTASGSKSPDGCPAEPHGNSSRRTLPGQYAEHTYQQGQQGGARPQALQQRAPKELAGLQQQQQQDRTMSLGEKHKEQGDERSSLSTTVVAPSNRAASLALQRYDGQQKHEVCRSEQHVLFASMAQGLPGAIVLGARLYDAAGDAAAAHAEAAAPTRDGRADTVDVPDGVPTSADSTEVVRLVLAEEAPALNSNQGNSL